jgi:hypothetical protein
MIRRALLALLLSGCCDGLPYPAGTPDGMDGGMPQQPRPDMRRSRGDCTIMPDGYACSDGGSGEGP